MATNIYNAFLSRFDEHFNEIDVGTYDDMDIGTSSKQDARMKLAQYFIALGAKAILSNTSEEVWVTLKDGRELVYFGFDKGDIITDEDA